MNRQAKEVLEIAEGAHKAMRISRVDGLKAIELAEAQLRQIRAGAKRNDLVEFVDSVSSYLDIMGRQEKYSSVLAGGLDALTRRASQVRETSDDLTLRETA